LRLSYIEFDADEFRRVEAKSKCGGFDETWYVISGTIISDTISFEEPLACSKPAPLAELPSKLSSKHYGTCPALSSFHKLPSPREIS
jgi:hypothetical protein